MEGTLSVPVETMISELQKWLHSKYRIYAAYRSFADRIRGPWRDSLVEHWQEHSDEETENAYDIAMKIVGLGGDPAVGNISVPLVRPDVNEFCLCLIDLELDAISTAHKIIEMSGTLTSLKIMAENIMIIDTQHLDDLRRMCNLQSNFENI
jgi:bacterioferritin (cytochrome b1)